MANLLPMVASPKTNLRPGRMDAAKIMTVFVLTVVILYFGREVLVPVTLALLLTFLLAPLVNWLRRIHLGRVPSVLLAVTLALAVLFGIGGVIGTQIKELAADLPNYASTIEAKVNSVKLATVGRLSHVMNDADMSRNAKPAPASPATKTDEHHGANQAGAPPAAPQEVSVLAPAPQPMPSPWQLVETYISPLISPLATFGIVFVVAVFALLQREDLRDRLIRLIGPDDIHRTTLAMDDAGRRLTRYFLTQLAINTAFGIVIGTGLYFIGVPKPVLWGMVSAVLRFIPYVGSFIAALLPVALSAAVQPGWSMALWTLAFYGSAEAVTGQVLEPLMYGQSSGLSPFSVVVAAIFWSWVWGPVGLFLSTPLTLCLAVMGRHVQGLEFLDVALGDRPPLTPNESFYQRILANDADEVLQQAEIILKEAPLVKYYDDVALPGMQLAANDAERGIMSEDQQESVKATIYELVEELSAHRDHEFNGRHKDNDTPNGDRHPVEEPERRHPVAASWQLPPAVLSIAGRGPLDEPAASMLVQLLGQRGIGSTLVKYRDVSRYSAARLETTGVAMVCIAYLNISGNPAHLRYLIQRLRRVLPTGTPILVGLWSPEDAVIREEETRRVIGADYYANSFAEVLETCLKLAAPVER